MEFNEVGASLRPDVHIVHSVVQLHASRFPFVLQVRTGRIAHSVCWFLGVAMAMRVKDPDESTLTTDDECSPSGGAARSEAASSADMRSPCGTTAMTGTKRSAAGEQVQRHCTHYWMWRRDPEPHFFCQLFFYVNVTLGMQVALSWHGGCTPQTVYAIRACLSRKTI